MLDHVFTDAIGALRDAFERAFLERQAFEEHFQVDVLLGDITWETSYGLPGEGQPPRVVSHITFDWPTWSQTSYRRWYVEEVFDEAPTIEMEIVFRAQRLAGQPEPALVAKVMEDTSPLIGAERLEQAGITVEIGYLPEPDATPEYTIEVTYEGLYELAEETLADGASQLLDEHFGALGGWIAATLVRLGDLGLEYLPGDDDEWTQLITTNAARRSLPTMSEGSGVVLYEVSERIATVTLNRPQQRNALSSELLRELNAVMRRAGDDDGVDVVILTGADPAFCAGLDLKELGDSAGNLGSAARENPTATGAARGPFPNLDKPLIGAINGVAVTGGLELALNCDFLVASQRAKFGDTHSRVGVMPGWGLTVLLAQAVGVRRPREMSFTGNFMGAEEAFEFGFVNHVVAHEDLVPYTRSLALDIIGNDQPGVRQIRRTYAEIWREDAGWDIEARDSRAWQQAMFSKESVATRRAAIISRGRTQ